jgi:hypothetical protein
MPLYMTVEKKDSTLPGLRICGVGSSRDTYQFHYLIRFPSYTYIYYAQLYLHCVRAGVIQFNLSFVWYS